MAGSSEENLRMLRQIMIEHKISYYVIPSTDAHGSEYLAEQDQRLKFFSKFTGSAGTAVIGLEHAWLFTDSRFWVQANEELDEKNWILKKVGSEGVPEWDSWLTLDKINHPTRIGIDPSLISHTSAETLELNLGHKKSELVYTSSNYVDLVWGPGRPAEPHGQVFVHSTKYSGQSAEEKIEKLRGFILENLHNCCDGGYLISCLSELCWLLNIRGSDIPFNPFPFAYLYISTKSIALFIDPKKLTSSAVKDHLDQLKVKIYGYDHISDYLSELSEPVLIDSSLCVGLAKKISKIKPIQRASPITKWKSLKNSTEIEGFRKAYLRDGLAWCRWAAWLERVMEKEESELDEWKAAIEFDKIRALDPLFVGLSYPNISATNENAALPHYEPIEARSRVIDRETMYLNDSGCHYLCGTTDTTRTMFFGKIPSAEQKLAYTVVLQGHIAVATATFPAISELGSGDIASKAVTTTTGGQLDVLARLPGWRHGLLYGHGTGHGVGCFSSVHEGPHGIGTANRAVDVPLESGHCFTVEPGHYNFEKRIGVRIESFYAIRERKIGTSMHGTKWFDLERITQVPISKNLIDWELLDEFEKDWVNALKDLFDPDNAEDQLAMEWLMKQ
ncbi:Xaa-Pro dipeptidase [Phakopsora pachyrhizi]|uniref:Xaa-Pro dipeptidase n=1 Tax=Phakopsora pachyrhizi TaxID=170000 RepID=A0AAV0BJ89_PHAPC|nr:Xaa-Pro dipeptidase [Phakopsora pachyrhizi]